MGAILARVLGFFAGPLGKFALWGIGALAGIGALTAVYFSFVHQIEGRVLAEQRAAQLEQTIKDQEDVIKKQKALMTLQAKSSKDLVDRIDTTERETAKVDDFIRSDEAKKSDRPSSYILRNTIRMLGATK